METFTVLVERACGNDQEAWNELVSRLANLVWSVTQSFRLNEHDALDVGQVAWLQLARQLNTLRDPERVGLWLATTTRRECLRLLANRDRYEPVDPSADQTTFGPSFDPDPEESAMRASRSDDLWVALSQLPDTCQGLMRMFLADPEPSYSEIAEATGMPVGSIGPRRQRCLRSLRVMLTARE